MEQWFFSLMCWFTLANNGTHQDGTSKMFGCISYGAGVCQSLIVRRFHKDHFSSKQVTAIVLWLRRKLIFSITVHIKFTTMRWLDIWITYICYSTFSSFGESFEQKTNPAPRLWQTSVACETGKCEDCCLMYRKKDRQTWHRWPKI